MVFRPEVIFSGLPAAVKIWNAPQKIIKVTIGGAIYKDKYCTIRSSKAEIEVTPSGFGKLTGPREVPPVVTANAFNKINDHIGFLSKAADCRR